jgi:aryl-alcohol dehydrogenase-like predicted oxidoreductase
MNHRTLGRSTISVSEVGFGAWGIGGSLWKGGSDTESLAALHQAIDYGIRFIDTALAYGQGHSERLIGRLLKERSERITVATKIPPANHEWPASSKNRPADVFPAQHIIACTEASLKNLGVEQIDLLQLHVWPNHWTETDELFSTLQKLQQQGKIRYRGISINDHEPDNVLSVVKNGLVDTVQVIYNIFDPSPATALFPLCRQHQVGVIVRCPFDEGSLTGAITPTTTFSEGDWRARYFTKTRREAIALRVESLNVLIRESGGTVSDLAELALRFCLSHPDVSTVIPGMRKATHVTKNLQAAEKGALPTNLLEKLTGHAWPRNFY